MLDARTGMGIDCFARKSGFIEYRPNEESLDKK
jgi:hypothetical protein